jgi:SAM-dependent methyltransferase
MGDAESTPRRFYDAYGHAEWPRLETGIDGCLEFEETTTALETYLPDSGHILDAGGGSGRYAVWLAERGYEVTLLDISRQQVSIARDKAAERGVASEISIFQGSITDLGFGADTFDATCCLGGPLSHILDETGRANAVSELRRVSVQDAPVFVSVMGLLGMLQLYLSTGYQLRVLPELWEHGDYDDNLLSEYDYEHPFADTHFFRRAELETLLSEEGLSVMDVIGLEGLGSLYHDKGIRENVADMDIDERTALEETIHATNSDPTVADLSIHMLAVARA